MSNASAQRTLPMFPGPAERSVAAVTSIEFTVIGQPATQGSKKVVPIYKGGAPMIRDGRVLTRAVEDNPRTSQWRQEVAQAARQVYTGPLLAGALRLSLVFIRPRPKSHLSASGSVKRSAPRHPTTKPDTVKLTRAVEDALTGVLWQDDSQIVQHRLAKQYGQFFQVLVRVESLDGLLQDADEDESDEAF